MAYTIIRFFHDLTYSSDKSDLCVQVQNFTKGICMDSMVENSVVIDCLLSFFKKRLGLFNQGKKSETILRGN